MFTKYQLKTLQRLGFIIYTYDEYQEALKFSGDVYRIIRNRSITMKYDLPGKYNKRFVVYVFPGSTVEVPDKIHRVDGFLAALRYTR